MIKKTDKNSMDLSLDEARYVLGRFVGEQKVDKKMESKVKRLEKMFSEM